MARLRPLPSSFFPARPTRARGPRGVLYGALAILALVTSGDALADEPRHATPPTQPATPPAQQAAEPSGLSAEQVRRGVVQVEAGGRPLGVGTVLARDGRVLTSLSGLGSVEALELRYADNTVVRAKIGHRDKGWDLALLIPQSGRWLDGLSPTDTDPSGAELRSFLPKNGKLAAAPVGVKGRIDAKSKDGAALQRVLDVDLMGSTAAPGAPLLEASGRVVGILARACKAPGGPTGEPSAAAPAAAGAKPPCVALTFGVPVYAMRSFLMATPKEAVQPSPWLGLGGAPTEAGNVKGVKIVGVAPGSPAERAGLKAGEGADTIVAVDGQPVETPEQLADVIAKRAIGQQVKLLVFSGGKFREVSATLRAAP